VDQDDVEDLLQSQSQSHNTDLTAEELQELDSFIEHDSGGRGGGEEQDQDDTMPTSETEELLTAWDTVKTEQMSSRRTNKAVALQF
jgi:hypothetical protein